MKKIIRHGGSQILLILSFSIFIFIMMLGVYYKNYWDKVYNDIFVGVSLFFSLINCCVVSLMWIRRRNRELKIRMVYGYSRMDNLLLLTKDMIKNAAIALVIAVVAIIIFLQIHT
jgi:hypothetical protein